METKKRSEIIKILCLVLGLEPGDIDVGDSFIDDLHMSPEDLTDFLNKLEAEGYEVSKVDMDEVDTLIDLLEFLEIE